jgi:glucosyl-dolichyl phosphate glucuronosyltransferase
MSGDISISIIVCTCNRVASLQQTLSALRKVNIPAGCRAELIVVDNASTDSTADIVANTLLPNMQVVYLFEPKKGKSNCLNSALALARGETLVFTDDDVIPSENWLEQIALCFGETQCDALVGKVILAPHLERPWMTSHQKDYLAVTDFESGRPIHWVGANAAIRRSVLESVPRFDPELGPGALGLGEDTLFGYQMVKAGFRIKHAARAIVVHHPDKSRLTRDAWLQAARRLACSNAYIFHHWEHAKIKAVGIKRLWLLAKLTLRRLLQPPLPLDAEDCSHWELSYVYHLILCGRYSIERRRPRNYSRHGLSKLGLAKHAADMAVVPTALARRPEHSSL